MARFDEGLSDAYLDAGWACTDLIAWPERWVNRRVETIDMLAHEETRRRVSIDLTLTEDEVALLTIPDGVVVPLAVLTKEKRRNFDLRDESGGSVPVLGRTQNGVLGLIAAIEAADRALMAQDLASTDRELGEELEAIVTGPSKTATATLGSMLRAAEAGDAARAAVLEDATARRVINVCADNYVLFAVLDPSTALRRVLKYGYGDPFPLGRDDAPLRDRLDPGLLLRRAWEPDRARVVIDCPMAWRAESFHVEVVIPQELIVTTAVLIDPGRVDESGLPLVVGDPEFDVNRAALYTSEPASDLTGWQVYLEIASERRGRPVLSAMTAAIVAALLWAGVISRLYARNPGAAISLILALAAIYAGLVAVRPEPRLVQRIFGVSRRWLAIIALAAIVASASLALELPSARPVCIWTACAVIATLAALRLAWSAIRAPG